MFLLSDNKIDQWVKRRRRLLFFGLLVFVLPLALPRGWGIGLFTGFMLMSFGIYAFCFRKWRCERGLWMLAVLLVLGLGPCWIFFEYLSFRSLFLKNGNGGIVAFDWGRTRFVIDSFIALAVFSHIVKFSASVGIKNWRRTRNSRTLGVSAFAESELVDFLNDTWCDQCGEADLGITDPVLHLENDAKFIIGNCRACGSRCVSEIIEIQSHGL